MIWLIGNKGMLGSDLEIKVRDAGIEYFASDIEIDITNIESMRKYLKDKKIKWIINCSAYTAVDKAEDEPEKAFKINSEGVLNIARLAKENNAVLIHISTDYVFDGNKEGAYTEEDKTNPVGVYGKSKLEGERNIVKALPEYFIIRTAWLYGRNGNNFVHTMLRLFSDRNELKVVQDQFGSPTNAKDLADVIVNIVKNNSDKHGIYNFTNNGRTNWYEFASTIYELAREKIP